MIRVVPPVVVILSMTLVGHATSRGVLTGMLLSLHLAGIGYWLAALHRCGACASRDGSPRKRWCGRGLATLAEEFGRLALVLVAMLVVAGLCYAALLLGWSARCLPPLQAGVADKDGAGQRDAGAGRGEQVPACAGAAHRRGAGRIRLRRSIEIEMGIAGLILLATSLLTTSVSLPMGGM